MDEIVHFRPSSEFKDSAGLLFAEIKEKLATLLPFADIQHIGATAVPGLLTKGDLDINIRVESDKFDTTVDALKKLFEMNQPHNWTPNYASFKVDTTYDLPVGIQLTVIGTPDDEFLKHRDTLQADPKLVAELNEIKQKFEGKEMSEYREGKGKFYKKL